MSEATPTTVGAGGHGPDGLTAAEVAERVADGRVNHVPDDPSRTTAQILKANVLTPVNAIVGVLLVLVVIADGIGPDMLFGLVIVANSVIGTVQEMRARAALERLAVLNTPHATVIRDGATSEHAVEEVVADDLLVLTSGAQVVVDGEVVSSAGLEIDESLLTGESDPVHKAVGDTVMSGSFVSAGSGTFRATKVGADSYAASLAGAAREFSLVHSELRTGVNRILEFLMVALPPIALILLWRLWRTSDDWHEALSGTVAAGVAMVPDGLVLLTSLAFMAGVVKLARRNALLKELASVEMLARVDTLCLDKTGTITTGQIVMAGIDPLPPPSPGFLTTSHDNGGTPVSSESGGGGDVGEMLAALAASDPDPNATLAAIAHVHPDDPGWHRVDSVPFSSARKWSAAEFDGRGAVYLGAPEILAPGDDEVAARVQDQAVHGRRVVLVATAPRLDGDQLPDDLVPRALVLLEDDVRDDARDTLAYLSGQGIDLKVISGDHPVTVGAVAARAGVPDAGRVMDARDLPVDDDEALADAVAAHTVFGRVQPHQKRAMVRALQSRGHVVGMTGDGVNDVLALKDADIGVAMGSGSPASRAVAQIVLLDNKFATLPYVVGEGRRVIGNIERVSNLFLTKTVYSVLLALLVGLAGLSSKWFGTEPLLYPFQPIHVTIAAWFTIGIPAFILSLAPNNERAHTGFVRRVMTSALPSGVVVGLATFISYLVAYHGHGATLVEQAQASTAALITLLIGAVWVLAVVARPYQWWRVALVSVSGVAYVVIFAIPLAREKFMLDPSNLVVTATGMGIGLVAAALIEAIWWIQGRVLGEPRILWRTEPTVQD